MANTYNINNKVTVPVNPIANSNLNYTITGTTLGATGSSGAFSTVLGSNGTSWGSTITANAILSIKHDNPNTLEVKGNIVMNGVDLEERLKTIEKVLMIPERDAILEKSYPLLKQKYDDYIKTLSKYRIWESIKGENE
jgi:hypothetical protein